MKKILTLSIILCSLISKGQTEYKYNQDSTTVWIRTNTTDTSAFGYTKQKKDTTPAIFQVSDTARPFMVFYRLDYDSSLSLVNNLSAKMTPDTSFRDPQHYVYWIKGYVAKVQSYLCCDASYNLNARYYWSTDSYINLDADKKPLTPNIIVWLSKEL